MECIGNAYGDCKQPAVWVRMTQFAGDHPLCDKHAKEDKHFLVDDSYQVWSTVEKYRIPKIT